MKNIIRLIVIVLMFVNIYAQDKPRIGRISATTPYNAGLIFRLAEINGGEEVTEELVTGLKNRFMKTGLYKNMGIELIEGESNYYEILFKPEYVENIEDFQVEQIAFINCDCLDEKNITEILKQRKIVPGYKFIPQGMDNLLEKIEKATKDVHTWRPEKKSILENLYIQWIDVEKINEKKVKIVISLGCHLIEK